MRRARRIGGPLKVSYRDDMMRKALDELGVAWATFFYVGRSPKAPGTMGSLAALPLAWYVWQLPWWAGWAITAMVFVTGTLGARVVFQRTGESDHQSIVIDEVLGILITTSFSEHLVPSYLLAFGLFRFFDIWKPWPIRFVDKNWKSPLGTMLDDACAAAVSLVLMMIFEHGMYRVFLRAWFSFALDSPSGGR